MNPKILTLSLLAAALVAPGLANAGAAEIALRDAAVNVDSVILHGCPWSINVPDCIDYAAYWAKYYSNYVGQTVCDVLCDYVALRSQ